MAGIGITQDILFHVRIGVSCIYGICGCRNGVNGKRYPTKMTKQNKWCFAGRRGWFSLCYDKSVEQSKVTYGV